MEKIMRTDRRHAERSKYLKRAISGRVGIIRSLYRIPVDNDDPRVYLAASELCDAKYLGVRFEYSRRGGGAALIEEDAVTATIGEAIERYCAIVPMNSCPIFGSYKELSSRYPVVNPEKFALYSPNQYKEGPFIPFTNGTRVSWCSGISLKTGKEAYVPEQRVYMHFVSPQKQENLGHVTTTGLASGKTMKEAVLSGLLESLERDAFTIFWMNQLPVEIYDLKLSQCHSAVLTKLMREKFLVDRHEYILARLPIDHDIAVFFCVLVSSSPIGFKRVLSVGAACRVNPLEAALKAMIEAVQGKSFILQQILKDPDWQAEQDFCNVTSFDLHTQLYTRYPEFEDVLLGIRDNVSGRKTLDDLVDDSWEIRRKDVDDELSLVQGVISEKGYEAFVVDLTTPDVVQLGMRVVRVLVPELIHLHGDHRYPFRGGRRIYEIPEILGYQRKTEDELNPYPHPFP